MLDFTHEVFVVVKYFNQKIQLFYEYTQIG